MSEAHRTCGAFVGNSSIIVQQLLRLLLFGAVIINYEHFFRVSRTVAAITLRAFGYLLLTRYEFLSLIDFTFRIFKFVHDRSFLNYDRIKIV